MSATATPPTTTAAIDDSIHAKRWWTLSVLCLSLVLIVAGNSSLNVSLPDIQQRLGSSPSSLQWIVDIYGLVFAGLLLPAGALADRFGRKTALQGGLIVFALSAFVASFGSETWHLIAARAAMGVGAAFIMPGTLSILTNVFHDPGERRKAISIWAGFAGLGGALGTVVTGLLLARFTWSSTFLINVPIALVALVAGLWLVPNSSDPREARLDPPGALLAIAGLATAALRDHRGAGARLDEPRHARRPRRGRRVPVRLRPLGAAHRPPDARRAAVQEPLVRHRLVDDHPPVHGDVRALLRPRPVPAAGPRVLTAGHRVHRPADRHLRHDRRPAVGAERRPLRADGASSGPA